ncbi:hypothetical protein MNV49_007316 [Pseudohyphozyma bogoriensis]|nr:hypothetical protein MNV49_007316 [Pseudohyphozyma bogoriensis]
MPVSKPQTIILWVHPRSTSTMFECAMLQKDDVRVLHEPMGDAWYFGPETWHNIVTAPSPNTRTFSKDMAQYIFAPPSATSTSAASFSSHHTTPTNPTLIPTSLLLDPSIHHTFLIRTPEKAVPSYHRLCYPGSETGFEYWDPEEAGYLELRKLFEFLRSEGMEPEVIDSEDLLKKPEEVMSGWCERAGVEFEKSMLEWNEGTREHFAKWPGFHCAAENSKGIGKGVKAEHKTACNYTSSDKKKHPELSEEVKACIEDNMPHYLYMKQFVGKV